MSNFFILKAVTLADNNSKLAGFYCGKNNYTVVAIVFNGNFGHHSKCLKEPKRIWALRFFKRLIKTNAFRTRQKQPSYSNGSHKPIPSSARPGWQRLWTPTHTLHGSEFPTIIHSFSYIKTFIWIVSVVLTAKTARLLRARATRRINNRMLLLHSTQLSARRALRWS